MATFDMESHLAIIGRSSGGKTYMFREAIWKRTQKRIVFFNTQREAGFGPEITRWDPRLLYQPGSKVNLCPPIISARQDGNAAMIDLLAQVVDDLIRIGNRAATDRRGLVVLAVDEAHLISPKGSKDDPLSRISTNGNRYGIKGIAITQRPALLSHTVLSQAPNLVMFDLDEFEQPYLDTYNVPTHAREWVSTTPPGKPPGTPNRRFALRQGKTWTLCNPVTT